MARAMLLSLSVIRLYYLVFLRTGEVQNAACLLSAPGRKRREDRKSRNTTWPVRHSSPWTCHVTNNFTQMAINSNGFQCSTTIGAEKVSQTLKTTNRKALSSCHVVSGDFRERRIRFKTLSSSFTLMGRRKGESFYSILCAFLAFSFLTGRERLIDFAAITKCRLSSALPVSSRAGAGVVECVVLVRISSLL